ncbi:MAG: hypothetical protein NTW98_01075 [Candidatus Nomurabacteria bacterium]|nr:hypothetical protein [Candidatus Nomurabacteria bacterium]
MNPTELAPKIPTLEDRISTEMENILSSYPETNSLPATFKEELVELKKKFESLRKGEHVQPEAFEIRYNRHTSKIQYTNKNGETIKTSMGQIVSGMEWGNTFNLKYDEFNEKREGQKMYEIYALSFVKRETLSLLDKHITEREVTKHHEKQDVQREEAYLGIQAKNNTDPRELRRTGEIAEKMVQSLLMRLSIDNPNYGFEVVGINAYQDVNLKIDFIIKIKNTQQGVKTITTKNIQFTISNDPSKTAIKERQIQKLQNVILIQMPELDVNSFYSKWKNDKDTVSGPDRLINTEIEKTILSKIVG